MDSTTDQNVPAQAGCRDFSRATKRLRVFVATPLGQHGRGGIDRLSDSVLSGLHSRPELKICARRLVTRGQRGLFVAQFVFAFALIKFLLCGLFRKVDVLHIHLSDWGSSYRKAILGGAAQLLGIPYIVHLHGAVFQEFWSAAPHYLAKAIERLFAESNQIIVLGRHWAQVISDRVPEADHKIIVLPNATEAATQAQVPPLDFRVRITCLGELGQRKGTSLLIESLRALAMRHDWIATIAGNGDVERSRDQIAELGLGDRIQVPGWLTAQQTDELLRRTDILVLPSFAENLPLVILEAFAHGVPVISTPVGAIPEVLENRRNGLLVPVNDVPSLSAAIEKLIDDPDLRRQFGGAALEDHTAKYEIGTYVSALAAIWWSASKASPSAPERPV